MINLLYIGIGLGVFVAPLVLTLANIINLFKKKKNNNIQDNKETVTTQNTALVKEEKGNCIFFRLINKIVNFIKRKK